MTRTEIEKICNDSWHGLAGIFEKPFVYVGITPEAWEEENEYYWEHGTEIGYTPLWKQRGEAHELFIITE